jgi:hypothetical protein
MWMLPANIRTGCGITTVDSASAPVLPGVEYPDEHFQPGRLDQPAWVRMRCSTSHPLNWPIQVQFCQPAAGSVADEFDCGGVELTSTKPQPIC